MNNQATTSPESEKKNIHGHAYNALRSPAGYAICDLCGARENTDMSVIDCYRVFVIRKIVESMPVEEHNTNDGNNCWCKPKVIPIKLGGFIFSHNDLIDRELLKRKLGLIPDDTEADRDD